MEEESEEEEEEQDDMDVQGIKKEKNVKQVYLIFFAESLFFIRFFKKLPTFLQKSKHSHEKYFKHKKSKMY